MHACEVLHAVDVHENSGLHHEVRAASFLERHHPAGDEPSDTHPEVKNDLVVDCADDVGTPENDPQRASHRSSGGGWGCEGQRAGDHLCVALPRSDLGAKLAPAARRQGVRLGSAVVLGEPPLACDPSLLLQPVEGSVERAFLNEKMVVRRRRNSRDRSFSPTSSGASE